jgi:hypothetical protein
MVHPPDSLQAVLTGDVIDSSRLSPADRRKLPLLLKNASRELRKAFPSIVPFDLEVFRGDSWQLVVSEPALCVRAALFLRSAFVASGPADQRIDTRVAIAVERIDFIPKGRVSEGDGPAYRASGEALDALTDQLRMSLTAAQGAFARDASVIVRLIDAIVQEWTGRQALAVTGRLRGWTQAKIARLWPEPITQQSVARHLDRAHWSAVDSALLHLENSFKKL